MALSNPKPRSEEETVVTTTCSSHCGGKCVVKVHVLEGKITRIETDDGEEPQLRACLRGRAYRQRIYSPDRLFFPLRRTGQRGEGKFERISWNEALDSVARELRRVKETYGPESILFITGSSDNTMLHGRGPIDRLLSAFGGCTKKWGSPSNEAGNFASLATYGTLVTRSTHDDLLNSRLILMWGWNPAVTITGTNTAWVLARAKEEGIRIICIDPRYTDTAAAFADQWIPIKPGTDTAMLLAMAHTMIKNHLQDQMFLERYTVGFDKFKSYVLGHGDGIAKTPLWAESISGVPAGIIEKLAVEYATMKPAALMCGIAPGRTAFGEQYHRAAITLSAMTGNIGIQGGSSAGNVHALALGGYPQVKLPSFGTGVGSIPNPVERGAPPRQYTLEAYGQNASSARIHSAQVADAILQGKAGGYRSDYKLLYIVGTSYPNQQPNINKALNALRKLEFIITHEQFMTPTAQWADLVLPSSTIYERNDVAPGNEVPLFIGYMHRVIDPLGESKSHFEIANELAVRLGIPNFESRSEEEWLKEIVKGRVPDYEELKSKGYHKIELGEPLVAFKEKIEDPLNHPFPTPSGKIEIYSQQLAAMAHPHIPSIPKYIEPWEGPNDPLAKQYPLQLITSHLRRRAHTQFETVPWLRELEGQALLINSVDAEARNIKDGDRVKVHNARGKLTISAKVTERIMPGIVDIPEGAWFEINEHGIDQGGSANILTKDLLSPGGAIPTNTCLVQVEKY